jgi:hypothetical protein
MEEPGPQITPIEESLGHWLIRIENEAQRETPQQFRQRERNQEIRDLRQSLKKDSRFIRIVRAVRQIHHTKRPKSLGEFWESTCEDPMAQAQEEYLSLMGQRLGWYVSILGEIEGEEHQPQQVIRSRNPPPPPRYGFEQMQRPRESKSKRREEFWDCSDLGAIKEQEHK